MDTPAYTAFVHSRTALDHDFKYRQTLIFDGRVPTDLDLAFDDIDEIRTTMPEDDAAYGKLAWVYASVRENAMLSLPPHFPSMSEIDPDFLARVAQGMFFPLQEMLVDTLRQEVIQPGVIGLFLFDEIAVCQHCIHKDVMRTNLKILNLFESAYPGDPNYSEVIREATYVLSRFVPYLQQSSMIQEEDIDAEPDMVCETCWKLLGT